jgi:hypothetical protein
MKILIPLFDPQTLLKITDMLANSMSSRALHEVDYELYGSKLLRGLWTVC